MTLSLRTRLSLGVVLGTGGLLALFSVGLYEVTRQVLLRHFDRSLWTTARVLSAVVEEEWPDDPNEPGHHDEPGALLSDTGKALEFNLDVGMIPEFNQLDGGAYYEFRTVDSTVLMRSPSLGNMDLPFVGFRHPGPPVAVMPCALPQGRLGRMVTYWFSARSEEPQVGSGVLLSLTVARDTSQIHDLLRVLRRVLWGSSAVTVLLAVVVAGAVTRTSLRPVRRLGEQIANIDEGSFDQRVSVDDCPAELAEIPRCLNGLLGRIARSFERERRFTADVAHELRTPLAGLQSALEVCLLKARDTAEYRQVLQQSLKITQALGRLVHSLLALGRLEAGTVELHCEPLSLRDLIEDCWQAFADRARDRGVTFENRLDKSLVWTSDRDHVAMVLSNLLDNAAEYCNDGGRIWVEAIENKAAGIAISNTGCTLGSDDVECVFESFWRADSSRTNTGRHCGVGLAVVHKVACLLGLRVGANVRDGVFTIRLMPT